MLAATNNFDYGFEATLATGVHDAEGRPINTVVEDNYSRNTNRCCQVTVRIFTSAVGTLVLLCFYLIGGAWMFRYLEQGNEVHACYLTYNKYLDQLNTSVLRATGIAASGLSKDEVATQLQNAMIEFAEALFALDFQPSKNCSLIHSTSHGSQWNLVNALYFCATVVTTIGYGHIAPTTQWGRLVCVFYCLLGIPLLLIYLGSIGQLLAYLFRFTYRNICCCRCFRDTLIRQRNRRHMRLIRLQEDLRRHMEVQAKLSGEPIPPPSFAPIALIEDSDEDDEIREIYLEFQETEEAGIPITVVMLVITAYVTMGAFTFRIWEKDWSPIDSAYFAVITISTIGFGDLFPGKGRLDQPDTIYELLTSALYCVFGLALLSMCFELMKDEFIAKIRWIGQSLRILGSNRGNQDYEKDNQEALDDAGDMSAEEEEVEAAGRSRYRADSSFVKSTRLKASIRKKNFTKSRDDAWGTGDTTKLEDDSPRGEDNPAFGDDVENDFTATMEDNKAEE
ncbi:unnamed protein product [Mesocestoides corti]|nr:unnamed protein product [Mesocestoides corti]